MSGFPGEDADSGCGCILVAIAFLLLGYGPGIAKALIAYLESGSR